MRLLPPGRFEHRFSLSVQDRVRPLHERLNSWRFPLLAALSTGVFLAAVWLQLPPDPRYRGKKLSNYLYDLRRPLTAAPPGTSPSLAQHFIDAQIDKQREAERAVQTLGPRAVPLISSWLQSEWGLREKLQMLAARPGGKFAWLRQLPWLSLDPRAIAVDAICRVIPEQAGPIVKTLRKRVLARRSTSSAEAAQIFVNLLNGLPSEQRRQVAQDNRDFIDLVTADPAQGLDDPIVQVLSALLQYDPPADREEMVRRLWPFRLPHFNNVLRAIAPLDPDASIQNLLCLESGTAVERPDAAAYFADHPRWPERVVPLLLSNLVDSSSFDLLQSTCLGLASYRSNATVALPLLTNLLGSRSAHVARAASNAIVRIHARPPSTSE